VREAGLIAGQWLSSATSGKKFGVINPSDEWVLASVPDMGLPEIRSAIDAAQAAQVLGRGHRQVELSQHYADAKKSPLRLRQVAQWYSNQLI
jgi:succinate-semialdehyde dehydrogenase / glutarate-semialdehyde dehydrogenase